MRTVIDLPKTIGKAKQVLAGLDGLVTAKEWERAAIVWAFTEKGRPGPGDRAGTGAISIREFSRLGVAGLRREETVRLYRKAWQYAIDHKSAEDVRPGDSVVLPDIPWEEAYQANDIPDGLRKAAEEDETGATAVHAVTRNARAVATAIRTDPDLADAIASDHRAWGSLAIARERHRPDLGDLGKAKASSSWGFELLQEGAMAKDYLRRIVTRLQRIPEDEELSAKSKENLLSQMDRCEAHIGWIRAYARGEDVTDEITQFLQEQA